MGSFESLSGPGFEDWFSNPKLVEQMEEAVKDILDGVNTKIPKMAIVLGKLQQPLAELQEASKPFKAADRQILSWVAYLLVTRYLRDHQVGVFKRHLIASLVNALIFASLYPEEYRAQLRATKKFYATLAAELVQP